MQHISYQKIRESTKKWQLTMPQHQLLEKLEWVVTEKIHGANFSILVDSTSVQFAKRKEILAPDEDFFGYHALKDKLTTKARTIFELLVANDSTIDQICIYGELFGGAYPHSLVSPNLAVEAIQTGIYYSPNVEFSVFDIGYYHINAETFNFLDYNLLIELCEQVEILYCNALFSGNYTTAVNYPFRFLTTLPELLGYPQLPNNLAEGIVVKPVQDVWLSTPKGKIRPILKFKIPEFMEDARFQQAQKWSLSKPQSQTTATKKDATFWEEHALPLVTKQRLNNTISKVGKLSKRNKNRILELLKVDIYEELSENLVLTQASEQVALFEYIDTACQQLIKKAL